MQFDKNFMKPYKQPSTFGFNFQKQGRQILVDFNESTGGILVEFNKFKMQFKNDENDYNLLIYYNLF